MHSLRHSLPILCVLCTLLPRSGAAQSPYWWTEYRLDAPASVQAMTYSDGDTYTLASVFTGSTYLPSTTMPSHVRITRLDATGAQVHQLDVTGTQGARIEPAAIEALADGNLVWVGRLTPASAMVTPLGADAARVLLVEMTPQLQIVRSRTLDVLGAPGDAWNLQLLVAPDDRITIAHNTESGGARITRVDANLNVTASVALVAQDVEVSLDAPADPKLYVQDIVHAASGGYLAAGIVDDSLPGYDFGGDAVWVAHLDDSLQVTDLDTYAFAGQFQVQVVDQYPARDVQIIELDDGSRMVVFTAIVHDASVPAGFDKGNVAVMRTSPDGSIEPAALGLDPGTFTRMFRRQRPNGPLVISEYYNERVADALLDDDGRVDIVGHGVYGEAFGLYDVDGFAFSVNWTDGMLLNDGVEFPNADNHTIGYSEDEHVTAVIETPFAFVLGGSMIGAGLLSQEVTPELTHAPMVMTVDKNATQLPYDPVYPGTPSYPVEITVESVDIGAWHMQNETGAVRAQRIRASLVDTALGLLFTLPAMEVYYF